MSLRFLERVWDVYFFLDGFVVKAGPAFGFNFKEEEDLL